MSKNVIWYTTFAERHLVQAARLRVRSVDHGLFSHLGTRFWRVFLTAVVEAPDGLGFAALDAADAFAGYGIITPDIHRLHEQILRGRRLALTRACLGGALARPHLIPSMIRAALRAQTPDSALLAAQWMTIMVEPTYRRRGIAQMLFRLMSATLYERGVNRFHSPVEVSNAPSNALQPKLGGQLDKVVKLDGVPHNIWLFSARPLSALPPEHRLRDGEGMPRVQDAP